MAQNTHRRTCGSACPSHNQSSYYHHRSPTARDRWHPHRGLNRAPRLGPPATRKSAPMLGAHRRSFTSFRMTMQWVGDDCDGRALWSCRRQSNPDVACDLPHFRGGPKTGSGPVCQALNQDKDGWDSTTSRPGGRQYPLQLALSWTSNLFSITSVRFRRRAWGNGDIVSSAQESRHFSVSPEASW